MTSEELLWKLDELREAVEEQNEQLRLQNAILAVQTRNQESMFRRERNNEPPTSYSYTWTRFGADLADALHTFEEDLDK